MLQFTTFGQNLFGTLPRASNLRNIENGYIHLLCHTILLWCICYYELSLNATSLTKFIKYLRTILSSMICLKVLNGPSSLIHHTSFKAFTYTKSLQLSLQNIHPSIPGIIINKGNKIPFFPIRDWCYWPTNI